MLSDGLITLFKRDLLAMFIGKTIAWNKKSNLLINSFTPLRGILNYFMGTYYYMYLSTGTAAVNTWVNLSWNKPIWPICNIFSDCC